MSDEPSLAEAIATEFFGWRWVSHFGVPIKGTHGYPQECRVRVFAPPAFTDGLSQVQESDGTEPLAYCYCSSSGYPFPQPFSLDFDAVQVLEKAIRKRKLWNEYVGRVLQEMGTTDVYKLLGASCKVRCVAALAVAKGQS